MGRRKKGEISIGQKAYEAKAKNPSLPWHTLDDQLGVPRNRAYGCAYVYAQYHQVDWPPGDPARQERKPRALKGVGESYYEAASNLPHMSWSDLGDQYGVSKQAVYTTAFRWARRNNLPWPIPSREAPRTARKKERAPLQTKVMPQDGLSILIQGEKGFVHLEAKEDGLHLTATAAGRKQHHVLPAENVLLALQALYPWWRG